MTIIKRHAFGAIIFGRRLSFGAAWLFGAWCVSLLTAGLARADPPCPIPDNLALRDLALPAARQSVAKDRRLVILTLGGAHTAGIDAGHSAATYPARLEAALSAALPEVRISVVNEALPRNTAADIPPSLSGLIEKTGARLVIWGPGGRDLALRLNVNEYTNAIVSGIEAAQRARVDLILLDTTYIPSPTRMALMEPYRERLLRTASGHHLPLLSRHDLMLRWSKDGTLNLDARDPAEQQRVARQLFACIAQSLAQPIAAAVR